MIGRHLMTNHKSKTGRGSVRRPKRRRALLQLDSLEDRLLMTIGSVWDGDVSNVWSVAANWQGDVAPVAGDSLIFPSGAANLANVNDFAAGTNFGDITIADSGYSLAGNAIDLDGDVLATYVSGTSSVNLDIDLQSSRNFDVASQGTLELNSTLSGAGLSKEGAGTLVFGGSGANTYTSSTYVDEGSLVLQKDASVAAIPGFFYVGTNGTAASVKLAASEQISNFATGIFGEGSSLDLDGFQETLGSLTLQASDVFIGDGGQLTLTGQISTQDPTSVAGSTIQGGTLDLNGSTSFTMMLASDAELTGDVELLISSVVANGGIVKMGTGDLGLSGANTYDGDTIITAGVVFVSDDHSLGSAVGGTTAIGNASIQFHAAGLSIAEPFSVGGTGSAGQGVLWVSSGDATLTGAITLNNNAQIGAADGLALTVDGVIGDGSNAYNLTVANGATGRTTLAGDNGYGGSTSVDSGFLGASHQNAFGASNAVSTVTIGSGASLELTGGIAIPASKTLAISGLSVANTSKILSVTGNNTILGDIGITGDNNVAFDVAAGTTLTVSGVISGARDFDKNNAGTLVLAGTNTNTGAVNVGDGTMLVNGSLASASSVFVDGILGGEGILPAVTISNIGTLSPGNSPGLLTTGNLAFQSSGSTFVVQIDGTTAGSGYDQVAVTGTVDLAGATLSLSGGFTPAVGAAFTLIDNDGGDAVTGTFNGLPEGSTITIGAATYQISYVGGDDNDVVLTAVDVTYTWDGGDAEDSLWSSPDNWVGDVTPTEGSNLVFPSGASRLSNFNDFTAGADFNSITIAASDYDIKGNAIELNSGISLTSGSATAEVHLNLALSRTQTVSVVAGGDLILSGVISGSGFGISMTGGGTLEYTGFGANTYTGPTTVNAGTLILNRSANLNSIAGDLVIGNGTDAATVQLGSNGQIANSSNLTIIKGTLDLSDNNDAIGSLTMTAGIVQSGNGTLTLGGDVTTGAASTASTISGHLDLGGATRTFSVADGSAGTDLSVSALISGTGAGLIKAGGASAMSISGNNTYDGTTTVSTGGLIIAHANALGATTAGTIVSAGATLGLQGGITLAAEPITISGNGTGNLGAIWSSAGTNTVTGPITLAAASNIGAESAAPLTISGQITDGASSYALTKVRAGTVTLSAANSYDGGTTVSAGVLSISNGGALGTGAATVAGGAALLLSGDISAANNLTISGSGVSSLGAIRSTSGNNEVSGTIALGANATIGVVAGRLDLSGVIGDGGNTRGVTKIGAGTLLLSATDTYTGATTVNAGTLLIDGAIGGDITLAAGVLGGVGSIGGSTGSITGGILAPGAVGGAGLLTQAGSSTYTFGPTSTFAVDLDGTTPGVGYDSLSFTLSSTVNLGDAHLDVDLGFVPAVSDVFQIIALNGATNFVNGTFSGLADEDTFVETIGGAEVTFQISYGFSGVTLTVTDVVQTFTWDGGDADDSLWSSPDNWVGDVAPTAGARLVFPSGASRLTNLNDMAAGFDVYSIQIDAPGYDLSGNGIDLTGGITTTFGTGAAAVEFDVALAASQTFAVASGGTFIATGAISGSGFGVTKTDEGTLQYEGISANTYTGTTTVVAGTLELNRPASVTAVQGDLVIGDNIGTGAIVRIRSSDQVANTGYVTVNEGAMVGLDAGVVEEFMTLTMQGSTADLAAGAVLNPFYGLTTLATANNLTANIQGAGSFALQGTFTIDVADDPSVAVDLRISATLTNPDQGTGALAKDGLGVLAISGSNNYTGRTYAQMGILLVEGSQAMGTTGNLLVFDGASMVFDGPNLSFGNNFLYVAGAGHDGMGAIWVNSGQATFSGTMSLGDAIQIGAADSATLEILGAINDSSNGYNLTVANGPTGRTTLGASNLYGGTTTVTGGFLRLTDANALGDPAATAAVTVEDGASLELSGGITLPDSKSLTLQGAAVAGSSKLVSLDGTNQIAGDITLAADQTIDVASGSSLAVSGDIGESGGSRGLTKVGAGTLTLSGVGSYTSITILDAGTLLVDGDFDASAGVSVEAGTTLGGHGSVGMTVVMSGGTVAPGDADSTGILTTSHFNTTGGSIVSYDLDGPAAGTQYDQLAVIGGVYLYDATLSLSFGDTPAVGASFTLIDNDGSDAVGGTFAGLSEGSTITFGAATYRISYVGGDGNDVVLTAVDVSYVWSGASDDGRDWSIGGNWFGGVAPTPGSNLIFPASPVRTESLNNFAPGTPFHSITIAGAGYDIYGNGIGMVDGLDATYAVGSSSFALDVTLVTPGFSAPFTLGGGRLDLGGAFGGGSDRGVSLLGAGTFTFSGPGGNGDIGTVTVDGPDLILAKTGGALAMGRANVLSGSTVFLGADGQLTMDSILGLFEGTSLDLNGFDTSPYEIRMQGATINVPQGSTLSLGYDIYTTDAGNDTTNRILGAGTLDLGAGGTYFYVGDDPEVDVELEIGVVLTNGDLSKEDDGTLALTAANTYEGSTSVRGGVLLVENASALGTTAGTTEVSSNATLAFAGADYSIAEPIRIYQDGFNGMGALYVMDHKTTLTGVIENYDDSQVGAGPGATLELAGEVFGYSGYSLTAKSAPSGRVILSGSNTYEDDTYVTGGYLQAANSNAFGNPTRSTTIYVQDGGSLELSGGITIPANRSLVLDNFQVDGTSKLLNVAGNNSFGGPILLLNRFQSIDVADGTTLTLSGPLSGIEALDKNGAGTLVLSATSTLTGQVNAYTGTLVIPGDITTASGVHVTEGGTLAGTGTTPAVNVDGGGVIAPGVEGPGILNAGGIDLAINALYSVDLDGTMVGTQYDQINVAGAVALDGSTLSMNIGDGFLAVNGQTFTIINNDGIDAVTGTFANLPEGAVFQFQGQPFSISYVGGTGNDVVLTSVAIQAQPAVLTTPTAGSVYNQQLTASGGSGTGYVFTATGLPAGLSISPGGLIGGTPTTANPDPVVVDVTITDSLGSTSTVTYSVTVNPALAIAPAALPMPTAGSPYSQQLTTVGGSGSGYTYSAAGLPAGLSISPGGLIGGTPTSTTPATVLVTVTDGNGASTTTAYLLTAAPAASATGLASSAPTSVFGQPVTFTATVTSGFGIPTGTVRFFNGATLLGTGTLNAQGVATFTTSTLGAGTNAILAAYLGDGLFAASTSPTASQTVTRAASSTTLATSATVLGPNQPVTFTATVAGASGGTVSFFDGTTPIGTATLDGQGVATFTTSALATGSHAITAAFLGDPDLLASNSPAVTVTIAKATSNAGNVTSSAPQVFYGQDVTLTATFSAVSSGGRPMTGTVDFYDGSTYLGTAVLTANGGGTVSIASAGRPSAFLRIAADDVGGRASLATTGLSVGDHVIRALYSGDANYSAAISETPVSVQVDPATTSITLAAATTPAGTILTANVVVTSPGNPPLAGVVSFFDGAARLADVPVVNGVASYNVGVLTPGPHEYRAVYSSGGTSSPSGSTLVISSDGPRVIGLSRFGIHAQRTTIALSFNDSLDPARAQDVANYIILDDRGRRVPVTSARYDEGTRTVTLTPSRNLDLHRTYRLTVVGTGPNGLTGASGIALDGSGTGQTGTDFRANITWASLAAPGGRSAVTFVGGQAQGFTGGFRSYIQSILHATRGRAAVRLRGAASRR